MQIIHVIDDFLLELFPETKGSSGDTDLLRSRLEAYYSSGGLKAKVTIRENLAVVDLEVADGGAGESDFEKAIAYCNHRDFQKAKELLEGFLKTNKSHSEANRVLGQIYSEEGEYDKAQDYLIEALRWNPNNASALVMLGNIFSNVQKDVKTSQKYFDQAIKVKPKDHIILNNIGGNFLKLRQLAEAKAYFTKALSIKEDYANTHYGLALVAEAEKDLASCFYSASKVLKLSENHDALYSQATNLAIQTAQKIVQNSGTTQSAVEEYLGRLQAEHQVAIRLESDRTIALPAYLELAEKYKRKEHVIRFNPASSTQSFWIMHALVMLDYVLEARAKHANRLFYTDSVTRNHFARSVQDDMQKLKERGIEDDIVQRLIDDLYTGLNQQIHNTPVGLFVEEYLYHEFAEMRPYQFLALHDDLQNGIRAATNLKIKEMSPKHVFSVSLVYNLLKAYHFKDLFGLDLIGDFEASDAERTQAISMFHEFSEYRHDKNPGDEYKLLLAWAKVLNVDAFFELVPEEGADTEKQVMENRLNNDQKASANAEEEMDKFQKKAAEQGLNMAVVMYMADALDFFAGQDARSVKTAAMEIAMLGMNGIRPEQQGYTLANVPGKVFSGYHLLAYYYVSFIGHASNAQRT